MTPSSRSPFSFATRSVQTCFCSRGKLFGQPCDHCSWMFPTWDDHSTCVKCRFSAGLCSVDLHNPCEICQSWSLTACTWRRLRKSLHDARQKSTKRETEHWSCQAPVLLAWMDSASTNSELHPDMGSIADSDIREVDLELAAATAPAQVVTVSVHQSLVKEPPAIVKGQATTMDIVTPLPLCAQLITCAHASPLGITSNQILVYSTSTPAPLLVAGPSFPPVMQGLISMLPGAPISLQGVPGMLPVQYSAIQSITAPLAPYSAIYSDPYASCPFRAPPAWPMC